MAAGKQTRFGGTFPKCLRVIGARYLLTRLVAQYGLPSVIVINDQWREEETNIAKRICTAVTRVISNQEIGVSIRAGLELAHSLGMSNLLVVAADTYIPGNRKAPVPGPNCAIFDPYERVTIWHITRRLPPAIFKDVKSRIDWMIETQFQVRLVSGLVNVNTQEKLDEAREIEWIAVGNTEM